MNFLASIDFLQFAAAFLGGFLAGVWLNERRRRRDNASAIRSRQHRFIQVPFVGHGGRQVETLTCDRRER